MKPEITTPRTKVTSVAFLYSTWQQGQLKISVEEKPLFLGLIGAQKKSEIDSLNGQVDSELMCLGVIMQRMSSFTLNTNSLG